MQQPVTEAEKRRASRVIAFDPMGRVLLFRHARGNGESFWAPPGGGLEAGETFEQAAMREVWEELGVNGVSLRFLWEGICDFVYINRTVRQQERFFLIEGDLANLLANVEKAHAHEGILETRWWTLAEIESTNELVFPEGLASKLKKISE